MKLGASSGGKGDTNQRVPDLTKIGRLGYNPKVPLEEDKGNLQLVCQLLQGISRIIVR